MGGLVCEQEHLLLQSSLRQAGAPDDGTSLDGFVPVWNAVVRDIALEGIADGMGEIEAGVIFATGPVYASVYGAMWGDARACVGFCAVIGLGFRRCVTRAGLLFGRLTTRTSSE